MEAIWHRIESWFAQHQPQLVKESQSPVSNRELNHLEDRVGFTIPREMEESYKIHNGSWALSMFPEGPLMTIEAIEYEWLRWREVLTEIG